MKKNISILVIALAVAAGAFYYNHTRSSETLVSMAESVSTEGGASEVALAKDIRLGDENAPITIVEYASFTCPHCANFHLNTFKELKKNYIDTNLANFTLREVYFDRYGLWAGLIGRCGGDMRYFGMVDMFFKTQKEWIGSGASAEILKNLKTIGRAAGMKNEEMDICLKDEDTARSLVAAYQQNSKKDGITGTPTFVINGKTYGNMNYNEFSKVLDGIFKK